MANSKFSRFDAAEYLDTEEARVEFLKAAWETGDMAFILHSIGTVARAEGMSRVAEAAGLSRESLYRALRSEGHPEFATVMRVLDALNVRLTPEPKPHELEPA